MLLIPTIFLAIVLTSLPCNGQGTYGTFDELFTGLSNGHIATVNIDVSKCMSNVPPSMDGYNINVALRHWWMENEGSFSTNRVLHVKDHMKAAVSDLWLVREIVVSAEDESVEAEATWYYVNHPEDSEHFIQSCEMGNGAVFHKMTGELDETIQVTSYNMLKAELTLGRHVVGVVSLRECNGNLPSPMTEYTFGVNVWSFLIVDEGSESESIRIYSNFVDRKPDPSSGSPWALNSFGLRIDRSDPGTLYVRHGAFDIQDGSSESQFPTSEYRCTGSTYKFFTRRYERDGTYNTYADVKTALMDGHQVEMVNFAKYCSAESDPPEEIGNNIRGQMFDAWEWYNGSSRHGPGEALAFFNDVMSSSGIYNIEEAVAYPDDSLHVNSLSVSLPDGGSVVFQGSEHCFIGGSSVFHANLADKSPVANYDQLRSRFLSLGGIFEAVVDVSQCEVSVQDEAVPDVLTFIMWESFLINPGNDDLVEGFEGGSFNLVENLQTVDVVDDTAWEGRYLLVDPTNVGFLRISWVSSSTYEEIRSVDILCNLGEGLKIFQYYF